MFEVDEKTVKAEREKAKVLRKSTWWQNLIRNNAQCYYCQTPLTHTETTMDHIVPVSRGGKSTKGNIVICCKPCNNLKKDLTAVEWTDYIEQKLQSTNKS